MSTSLDMYRIYRYVRDGVHKGYFVPTTELSNGEYMPYRVFTVSLYGNLVSSRCAAVAYRDSYLDVVDSRVMGCVGKRCDLWRGVMLEITASGGVVIKWNGRLSSKGWVRRSWSIGRNRPAARAIRAAYYSASVYYDVVMPGESDIQVAVRRVECYVQAWERASGRVSIASRYGAFHQE